MTCYLSQGNIVIYIAVGQQHNPQHIKRAVEKIYAMIWNIKVHNNCSFMHKPVNQILSTELSFSLPHY